MTERSFLMVKKTTPIFILFFLLANLLMCPLTIKAETPIVTAKSAILIDADTGEILYEKNANEKLYPASITKIMTALLAIEKSNLDNVITMTDTAVFSIERGSSHIALDVNEEITLKQALYALLLVSANDAAAGIAESISGSIEDFGKLMTQKAKELGAKNTHFVNPHGLHDENHYTTAYDMALIARQAIKYNVFKDIISTTSYQIPPTNKQEETRYLYNQHKMLKNNVHKSTYFYDSTIGGKTGYTDQAHHTLVTYAKQGDLTLICVILDASSQDVMYTDTTNLFDFGFNQVTKTSFNENHQIIDTIPIYNDVDKEGNGTNKLGYVDLIAVENFNYYSNNEVEEKDVEKKIIYKNPLLAPIYKGDEVGKLEYWYNGTVIGTVPLIVGQTYEHVETSLISSLQQDLTTSSSNTFINLLYYAFIIIALLFAFILTIAIMRRVRRRR